jgi:hypothetical protein
MFVLLSIELKGISDRFSFVKSSSSGPATVSICPATAALSSKPGLPLLLIDWVLTTAGKGHLGAGGEQEERKRACGPDEQAFESSASLDRCSSGGPAE